MKLKPCPFCGGKAQIEKIYDVKFDVYSWAVSCKKCWAFMYPTQTRENAVQAWNTRKESK